MQSKSTLFICHWQHNRRNFFRFCFSRFREKLDINGECETLQECSEWLKKHRTDYVIIALPNETNEHSIADLSDRFPETEFIEVSAFESHLVISFYHRMEKMSATEFVEQY